MPVPIAVMMPRAAWGLVFGMAGAAACTTARPIKPHDFIPQHAPDVVWVTATDNSIVPVADPEIVGDTLRGKRRGTEQAYAIPLGNVRTVEAKLPDHAKTVMLLTAGGAALVTSVYFLWIAQAGPRTGGVMCGVDPDGQPYPSC